MEELTLRVTLEEAYKAFCRPLLAKGVAKETELHYLRAYEMLKKYFVLKKYRHIGSFKQEDWYDFTIWLAKTRKPVTVNTYLRGAKSILRWSSFKWGQPHVDSYPMMKVPQRTKEIYTEQDLAALIEPPKNSSFLEIRGWMLSCLLVYCALRAKTICSLKVSDFDLAGLELNIDCLKNKRVATFPLTEHFAHVVKEYLDFREFHLRAKKIQDTGFFFFDVNTGLPISRHGLYKIQSTYNLSRGVYKTGLHIFRNNFAKLMIQNGADAFTLQRWMTHSHIKSTEVYVRLYSNDLRRTVDKYNPFEQFQLMPKLEIQGEHWQQLSFFD